MEDLFEEAAAQVFSAAPQEDLHTLFNNTSKRLNNANVFKTEMLFFNLGMPWALRGISWRKFTNGTLCREFNKLVETRGGIAHGRGGTVRLQTLRRWKNMIEMFAPIFEAAVADHIQRTVGQRPAW